MDFSYTTDTSGTVVKISLAGRLMDKTQASTLLQGIEEQVSTGKNRFILDLSHLDYMNSSGLNVLVNILTKARVAGGEVAIANVSPKVEQLFLITKLHTLFTISESVEKAEAHLTGN